MIPKTSTLLHPTRLGIVRGLRLIEDAVYLGLGALLSISAIALLGAGFKTLIAAVSGHSLGGHFVELLDQILLVLLIIELLYTVQVSFREHALIAEPFIVVALIAVIRRILVLTAEMPKLPQADENVFRHALTEFALLSLMISVLVGSLIMLSKHVRHRTTEQAGEQDSSSAVQQAAASAGRSAA